MCIAFMYFFRVIKTTLYCACSEPWGESCGGLEMYWKNELSSLGIECKRKNEFNDNEELETLAIAIKEVYFQCYKTAYDNSNTEIIDELQFDYII